MKLLVALPVMALTLAAPAYADSHDPNPKIRWAVDVQDHGGPSSGIFNGLTGQTLGDAVCADLKQGNSGANEMIGVANDSHLSTAQAEIVVYWAITDLCTDQMSKRSDSWRDGG